jgi:mediator of RNA polymerase II transcription subunit 7
MMQDQLDRSRAETEGILKMKAQVENVLEGLGQKSLVEKQEGADLPPTGAEEDEQDVSHDIWRALRKEFG